MLCFLWLALFLASAHGQSCTTNDDCLDGCSDKPLADFVFLIDCSSSMQPNIDAVRNGLPNFVRQIQEKKTLARYAVVLYAMEPEVILDWTTDGDRARLVLRQVVAGAGNYFQRPPNDVVHYDHDCKHTQDCSTREPALEALRMVLGQAVNNTFARHPESKFALFKGEGITFRPSAEKYVFLVTDEDSDCPFHDENRFIGPSFGPQCTGPGHIVSDNDMTYQPTRRIRNNEEWPPLPHPWTQDITSTAKAIVDTRAHVSIFVRPQNGLSLAQFGNPAGTVQSQQADFSGFDAQKTLDNLRAEGLLYSLQTQTLTSQLASNVPADMRVFDTNDITKSNIVDNFFREVVAGIKSTCFGRKRSDENLFEVYASGLASLSHEDRKRQQQNCRLNFCQVDMLKCRATPRCDSDAIGCDNCVIDGVCIFDGDTNPTNRCETCNFYGAPNTWTNACDDKDDCTIDTCVRGTDGINECQHKDDCTPQCGRCEIAGECTFKGVIHPTNKCWQCDPLMGRPTEESCIASGFASKVGCFSYNAWSPILPVPSADCGFIDPCLADGAAGTLGCACDENRNCASPLANGTSVTCNTRELICEIVPPTIAPTPQPPVVVCDDPIALQGQSGCPCFANNTCNVPSLLLCAMPVRNECVLCQFNCHEHGTLGKRCRQTNHPLQTVLGECDEGLMCSGIVCVKGVVTPAPTPCAPGTGNCQCATDNMCQGDLECLDGKCVALACQRGANGCTCDASGGCVDGFICDSETTQCRYCKQGEEGCKCLENEVCTGTAKTLVCASGICVDTCKLTGEQKCCTPGEQDCVCLKGECSDGSACSIYDICDANALAMDPCSRACRELAKTCEWGANSCTCARESSPLIECREKPITSDEEITDGAGALTVATAIVGLVSLVAALNE